MCVCDISLYIPSMRIHFNSRRARASSSSRVVDIKLRQLPILQITFLPLDKCSVCERKQKGKKKYYCNCEEVRLYSFVPIYTHKY